MNKVVLLGVAGLLAATARANTIAFNTFGPGDTYSANQGYNIAGASSQIGYESTAAQFTSGATGVLSQVDLGITNVNNGTGLFEVFLYGNASGMPNNANQVLLGSGTPSASFGSNNSVVSVSPLTSVSLTSGSTYWLVVKPGASGVLDAWNVSLPNVPGSVDNSVNDSTWFSNTLGLPAFRLIVSGQGSAVPEQVSSVWLLLISLAVLVGVHMWRAQRSRARVAG
jgi:hypothetical protein